MLIMLRHINKNQYIAAESNRNEFRPEEKQFDAKMP